MERNPRSALSLLRGVVEGALRNTRSDFSGEARKKTWPSLSSARGSCPILDHGKEGSSGRTRFPLALETAKDLLSDREVWGVLLAAVHPPGRRTNSSGSCPGAEGAGAIVLKRIDQVEIGEDRVFATIEAIAAESSRLPDEEAPLTDEVTRTCATALHLAEMGPAEIAYIEASGVGVEEQDARGRSRAW